jgi:hypothetical protein
MAHAMNLEDDRGDLVDVILFCSDACHQEYAGEAYGGWNGARDMSGDPEWCAACGVLLTALKCGCDAGVVVNRFPVETPERCEHGGILQHVV